MSSRPKAVTPECSTFESSGGNAALCRQIQIDEGIQINQASLWCRELAQLDASFLEDLGSFGVHIILLPIYDLRNANLNDLNATSQARASGAVQHCAFADSLASSFEQCVLFSMNAQTCAQGCATRYGAGIVAPWAATRHTVQSTSRSSIVACGDDSRMANQNTANSTFHAVASSCCKRGHQHEIVVPRWPQPGMVGEIQLVKRHVKVWQCCSSVQDFNLCFRGQGCKVCCCTIQVLIISKHELVQRRWTQLLAITSLPKTVVANGERCFDVQQDEEWSSAKEVCVCLAVDRCSHKWLLPIGRDII